MSAIKQIIEKMEDAAEDAANVAFREMEKTMYDDGSDLSHDDIFEACMEHSIVVQKEFLNNALSQITQRFEDETNI